ncbi:MAG: chemotaxis protein CheW [Ectothiorhodospiraceae bacterium]|nr:chemotaxis protein CheW [Ectothiorhodospiraceae bacterium]MCH8502743.1 chemotaxis protein CheW [Ectothiorhodospiraceae bacterium]
MDAPVSQSPFQLLQHLEHLGRDHQAELPTNEEHQALWAGVAFRLGSQHFVAPMEQVSELLKYPDLSPVPRTKNWVRGMANVRGNLLPIMDLSGYLSGGSSSLTRASRVLVIDIDGVFTGLLVDEVFGMRHFEDDLRRDAPADLPPYLAPYIDGRFDEPAGGRWLLFSMEALARHPQFLKVAS